jgi:protein arginine kinase
VHELCELEQLQKQVLVERHLISREQAARNVGASAVIDRRQRLSLMVNEEDHLRMQAIFPGMDLMKAYKLLNKVDEALEESLPFAFDEKLGYLTACPTNLGTGMRASAMLHLPALVLSDQISQVLQAVTKIGLTVRGLFGEGTESQGHLFQISNQSTLGESEITILERLGRVLEQVANHELNAREKLIEEKEVFVADKVGRAYGLLKHARIIDSKEAYNELSIIRLGASLGFLKREVMARCDAWLMDIQPAHLQLHAKKELDAEERDLIRGEILRERLHSLESPLNSLVIDKDKGEDNSPKLL